MPATFLARARPPRLLAVAVVTTLAGLLLGVLGPFGSYLNEGPLLRAGYWIGAMWAGMFFYGVGLRASRMLAPAETRTAWAALAISVLLASLPEAVLTRLAAFRIWPELAHSGPGWAIWYAQVVIIGLVSVLGTALLERAFARTEAALPSDQAKTGSAPAQLEPLRGDVLALQMEDHYVRIHSSTGSYLILMPLGRAIETVTAEGLKTHRSWWVARHAVARVEGTARSMSLRLTNGIVAPVSRSSVATLRAAGWLEAERPGALPWTPLGPEAPEGSRGQSGLDTDLRVVARACGRVTAAVTASLLVLGAISLGLIRLLGLA